MCDSFFLESVQGRSKLHHTIISTVCFFVFSFSFFFFLYFVCVAAVVAIHLHNCTIFSSRTKTILIITNVGIISTRAFSTMKNEYDYDNRYYVIWLFFALVAHTDPDLSMLFWMSWRGKFNLIFSFSSEKKKKLFSLCLVRHFAWKIIMETGAFELLSKYLY